MSFAENSNLNVNHPLTTQRFQQLAIDSIPLAVKNIATYTANRAFTGADILGGLIQTNSGITSITMATGLSSALSSLIGNPSITNASFECVIRNNQATGISFVVTDPNITYLSTGNIAGYGSIGMNFVLTNPAVPSWTIL